ncbi:MAG TPA: ribonuclease HII [Thermohalobaculum sp.]|nr:ribonuclease HII [Thermohalobaculum sp.]
MKPGGAPLDLSAEEAFAGGGHVCGVDEAGRGPWAGPVVAAAVVLDRGRIPPGLDDSKKLTARRREALYEAISASAQVAVAIATVAEIDRLNILRANDLAMRRAVAALDPAPAAALIDGNRVPPDFPCPAQALIGGDGLSLSVAAASIIAKVTRDRMMAELARMHPGYGWETNQGYGTAAHRQALERLGVTPHHRRSFAPIHKMLCEEN